MPYIDADHRRALEMRAPQTPGELNYAITRLVDNYLYVNGISYDVLNAVSGVLVNAEAEFQRRVVAPYERDRRAEHGDVYTQV